MGYLWLAKAPMLFTNKLGTSVWAHWETRKQRDIITLFEEKLICWPRKALFRDAIEMLVASQVDLASIDGGCGTEALGFHGDLVT